MNLSAHFTLQELTASEYAARHGIDNTPNADVRSNLLVLASGLERVRSLLAVPIHVLSGYRSPKVNTGVGGSRDSQHVQGLAADIIAPGFGCPREVARMIADNADEIGFDQVIQEFGAWAHVSFGEQNRREVLTATRVPAGVVYTRGLT